MPARQFDNYAHRARHELTQAQIEVAKLDAPTQSFLPSRRQRERARRRILLEIDNDPIGYLALLLDGNPEFAAALSDEKRARTPVEEQKPLPLPSRPNDSLPLVVEAACILATALTYPTSARLPHGNLVVQPSTEPEQAMQNYQDLAAAQQQSGLAAV